MVMEGAKPENLLLTQTFTLINQHFPIPVNQSSLIHHESMILSFFKLYFCLPIFLPLVIFILTLVYLLGGPFLHLLLLWSPATPHPNPKEPVLMKYNTLIHRRNKGACEHAIHKASEKRNSVILVNLLNLLRDTRQSGGVNYQEGQLSWTFRTYIQRITQTRQSRHHTTYLSIQESLRLEFVTLN